MANLYIVKEEHLENYDLRQVISHYMLNIDVVIGNGIYNKLKKKDTKDLSCLCYDSITEYALELAKLFRLLKNEKTLLLSNEDMLTKISLILAKVQKEMLGDADVQVSDVIDAFRIIKESATAGNKQKGQEEESFDSLSNTAAKQYLIDIKSQNMIDTWTLYSMLSKLFQRNGESPSHDMLETVRTANVLMVLPENFQDSKLPDFKFANLLFPEETYLLQMLEFQTSVHGEDIEEQIPFLSNLTSTTWKEVIDPIIKNELEQKKQKRDENYHLHLFLGYLRLLINSRDELSLAKVLCGTGGIVKHDAFDVLKKESLQTKMPMYQNLVSYVQKIELGGKSYAPSNNHPFFPYTREFCLFAELMNKLNTKIEDEKDPESALRKVLSILKIAICKNDTGKVKTMILDEISEQIMEIYKLANERTAAIQLWISTKRKESNDKFRTPERSVGCGGSIVGRKNHKALRSIIDHFASSVLNVSINIHVMLGKIDPDSDIPSTPNSSKLSCSISPTSFPSIISLFKTPDAKFLEDDDIIEESLGKRLGLDKILGVQEQNKGNNKGVPKFNSNLAWAEETSPILISPVVPPTPEGDIGTSGSIYIHDTMDAGVSTPIGRSKQISEIKQVIEDAKQDADKALKEARQAVKPPKKCLKRSILKDINKVNKFPIQPVKDDKLDVDESKSKRIKVIGQENMTLLPSSNKSLAKKSSGPKQKKLIPLPKGQMKMTAFLRM